MNNSQFEQAKVSLLKSLILTFFLLTMRFLWPLTIIMLASWISALVSLGRFIVLIWLYHYR